MAFRDFTFPQVQHDLGLVVHEAELFDDVAPIPIRADFLEQLELGTAVALGANTEKARSEFLISLVLLELRRLVGRRLGVFPGVPLDADPARGLNGICDVLLTMSGSQLVVRAPRVTVVEAKNDNVANGLGQCIAATVAAQIVNQRDGAAGPVYGVVTTGSAWSFLHLTGVDLTIDRREVPIGSVGRLLAVLQTMVNLGRAGPP